MLAKVPSRQVVMTAYNYFWYQTLPFYTRHRGPTDLGFYFQRKQLTGADFYIGDTHLKQPKYSVKYIQYCIC